MSACRSCGESISWKVERGRNVPMNADGKPHRETCVAERGRVPERLKRPSRHVISPSKIKAHDECSYRFFLEHVQREEGHDDSSDAKDAGSLVHAAIEVVAVTRAKANDLSRPVSVAELHEALDLAVLRESWNSSSLAAAREIAARAAPKLDLSFLLVDEKGPWVERGFEVPVGGGVLVGGILDMVELVGNTVVVDDFKSGGFHESAENIPAVGLYAAFARLLWPEHEIRVVLRWLALDRDDEIGGERLATLEENAKAAARALVAKMRARRQDESAWPATVGWHCDTCPFRSRCEPYKARMAEPVSEGEPGSLEEVVAELHRIRPVANLYERRVKRLTERAKPLVASYVGANGRVLVGPYPVRLKTISRDGYTAKASTYQVLEVEDPVEAPRALPESVPVTVKVGADRIVPLTTAPGPSGVTAPAAASEKTAVAGSGGASEAASASSPELAATVLDCGCKGTHDSRLHDTAATATPSCCACGEGEPVHDAPGFHANQCLNNVPGPSCNGRDQHTVCSRCAPAVFRQLAQAAPQTGNVVDQAFDALAPGAKAVEW